MARTTATQLAGYQRRYRDLAERIAEIGFIAGGSITHRQTRCGKTNCRCHGDPPQLHGPYYQWTAKVDGKTVTRRLTQDQARSTNNGSPTTDNYAPSSNKCAKSPPKPPS